MGPPTDTELGAQQVRLAIAPFVLAALFLLGACLRLWGIDFGLPYLYHVDEPSYVVGAVRLGTGTLSSVPFDPTGLVNLLFAQYGALFLVGRLFGAFHSIADFTAYYETDRTVFYLLGRITSALLGALTILVVHRLGQRARGSLSGIAAAAFLTVAFLHVRDSHFATPDVATGFFAVAALAVLSAPHSTPTRRALLVGGALAGLAVATKWTAVWVLPAAALAVGITGLEEVDRRRRTAQRWRCLALLVAGVTLGGLLGGFQLLLNPEPYWAKAMTEATRAREVGYEGFYVDTVSAWRFYFESLRWGVGLPMAALASIGLVARLHVVLIRGESAAAPILVFSLPYAFVLLSSNHLFARYLVPLLPIVALLAAEGLVVLVGVLRGGRRLPKWRAGLASVLLVLAAIGPLLKAVRLDVLLTRDDTRTVAKRWIESNLPEGARIAVDWSVFAPPLHTGGQVVPWVPMSDKTYDVVPSQYGFLHERAADWYVREGFQYMITSSFITNLRWVSPGEDLRAKRFYEELDRRFEQIWRVSPYRGSEAPPWVYAEVYAPATNLRQRERPGPTLTVYRLP